MIYIMCTTVVGLIHTQNRLFRLLLCIGIIDYLRTLLPCYCYYYCISQHGCHGFNYRQNSGSGPCLVRLDRLFIRYNTVDRQRSLQQKNTSYSMGNGTEFVFTTVVNGRCRHNRSENIETSTSLKLYTSKQKFTNKVVLSTEL